MDCATCTLPASSCETCPVRTGEQPGNDAQVDTYLNLWRRSKRYSCLPQAGGVEDQDERLMKIFDAISDRVDERDHQFREEQQRKQEAQAKARSRRR